MTEEEMENLNWRLSSNWEDNWVINEEGFCVSCSYATGVEGRWWCREELKRFLRGIEVSYYEIEGPVW